MERVRVAFFAPEALRPEAASGVAAILGDPPESAMDDLAACLVDEEGAAWWGGCGLYPQTIATDLLTYADSLGCRAFAWSESTGTAFGGSNLEGLESEWCYPNLLEALGFEARSLGND